MTVRPLPPGRYGYDALAVGDVVETGELTVTVGLVDGFADLTGDRFAIHMDDAAARARGFPARVAHGLLVLSLVDGLKNRAPAQFEAVASLGWEIAFEAPVVLGDVLTARFELAAMRATRRADRGILTLDVTARAGDRVVQRGRNRLMVERRARLSEPGSPGSR